MPSLHEPSGCRYVAHSPPKFLPVSLLIRVLAGFLASARRRTLPREVYDGQLRQPAAALWKNGTGEFADDVEGRSGDRAVECGLPAGGGWAGMESISRAALAGTSDLPKRGSQGRQVGLGRARGSEV